MIENAVYNYLESKGYNVDVGIIEKKENGKLKQLEVDFVCNQFNKRYYIQVAQNLDTREKTIQESKSLLSIPDNFEKIILVNAPTKTWITEEGIKVINIIDFLLEKENL